MARLLSGWKITYAMEINETKEFFLAKKKERMCNTYMYPLKKFQSLADIADCFRSFETS